MDLMRTLLIYMSATLALAVQNTAAPKETPAPTPVPEAIVETVETPGPGEETLTAVPPEQQEPEQKEQITPLPVPTITPNVKGYHNLKMGDKGKEVKKLQEKLIETGYLPEGAADGAYGRQTYNAVKKFQYYNGLKADGIAGRATQTNLFENPDIALNPETANTPEAPTEAPADTLTESPAGEPTEAPAEEPTEAPAEEPTEAPAEETTEAPAEEPTESPTEEPAEEPTEEPAEEPTEEPADKTAGEPEDTEPDVVENVDLDADEYELFNASIALNEGAGPLEFVMTKDGVPVTARPRVSRNGDQIRVSLDDLCACVENWRLTDEGVGSVVLEAAGYTLALYNEDGGCSATVDGMEIPMKEDDFDFITEGHFINAEFLAGALKGQAEWDQEENTLMLRIRDKEAVQSAD